VFDPLAGGLNQACRPSISGLAPLKMVWKTPATTMRKISGPAMGCKKTESRRRVQMGGAGAR
jgi:hypothetical protein